MSQDETSITELLARIQDGDGQALSFLFERLYPELRQIAAARLRRERRDHTLQPTAIVNEAFLRMVDQRDVTWKNRAHFLGIAAQTMRRLLVDHARRKRADKRWGLLARVTLDDSPSAPTSDLADVLAVDEALDKLAAEHPVMARVIELRCFGGLTAEETAEALGVSRGTIQREWRFAKAWLQRTLSARGTEG